jgi:uncharacterized damage-inducible protein DinB
MFRYNRWANLTLLEACRDLTQDQMNSRPPHVSGSIAELMLHLVGSQQTFVLRTEGRQHEGEWTRESAWPGIDAVISVATRTSDQLIEIALALDIDTDVDLPYMSRVFRFPCRFFLTHAFAHGTEHRTEIKFALAEIGIETPDLDGWQYAAAAGFGDEITDDA